MSRELVVSITLLSLLALHAFFYKSADTDFAIFARAGERYVAGTPLYRSDDATPSEGSGWSDRTFKYTPAAAAFFVPFALLPGSTGRLLFLLLSVAALSLAALWCTRAADLKRLTWLPIVLFLPLAHHQLSLGQSDALVLGLFAAAELTLQRHPWASAVLAAMCILLKVTFILPVLALALTRRGENVAKTGAALLLLGVLLPLRYGVSGAVALHREWLSLLSATTPELLCRPANQGVWAIACEYVSQPPSVALIATTAIVFVAVAAKWLARSMFPLAAAAIFFAALWSPLCWRSTLTCLLPAYFLAVAALDGARKKLAWGAVAAAVLAGLPLYDLAGPAVFSHALQLRVFGLAALICFVLAAAATARAGADVTTAKARA